MARTVDEDELIEHWTLLDDEMDLLAGRRGATRLAFAVMLKFLQRHGRFPKDRGEIPEEVVEYVATSVKVSALELGFYEWDGRTSKAHRKAPLRHGTDQGRRSRNIAGTPCAGTRNV